MKLQPELSDQQLLDSIQAGNVKAYNLLFNRYFKRIYGFTFSLLKDSETAKELAMDVMIRLWQKDGKISAEQGLKSYLFKSVRNSVYNHLRKSRLLTHSLDSFPEYHEMTASSADIPLLYKELEDFYTDKLQGLSPQRRRIFEFSRIEDLTYNEIAEKMNISVSTVRNQMSSTLRYFREHMAEHREISIFLFLISITFRK
ncbi:RNA polymerase sigma-70 factor [Pedobacter psychrodurus]|uniref:RNA polymerase sigma factor n=1 Tax=Pedobacter psychrodurus TaxID=2530456 RepID=UPI002931DA53|nr:RNA polymerase sigma-70 factor [Pedobacter psychrodurus]